MFDDKSLNHFSPQKHTNLCKKNRKTPLSPVKKSFQTTFEKRTPIIMKSLFFACLIGSAGIVQATNTYAQTTTISLNVENLTVGEILQQIEEKTDFSFFTTTVM